MNKFAAIVLLATGVLIANVNADSCIVCDSENDPYCVRDAARIMPRDCRTSTGAGCYTRIVGTRTLRGCVDDVDEGVFNACNNDTKMNCQICHSLDSTGCNSNIFPAHRLLCHQCSGPLSSNCSAEYVNPEPCQTYNEVEQCYIHKTSDKIERGCLSETKSCSNENKCLTCKGQGCNYFMANDTQVPLDSSATSMAVPSILIAMLALIAAKLR